MLGQGRSWVGVYAQGRRDVSYTDVGERLHWSGVLWCTGSKLGKHQRSGEVKGLGFMSLSPGLNVGGSRGSWEVIIKVSLGRDLIDWGRVLVDRGVTKTTR